MAKIWYLSGASRTVRERRPVSWCIDKLWLSPRDFRSPTAPQDVPAESVWVEITEDEVGEAPGYKTGFHLSYLTPSQIEERLRKV